MTYRDPEMGRGVRGVSRGGSLPLFDSPTPSHEEGVSREARDLGMADSGRGLKLVIRRTRRLEVLEFFLSNLAVEFSSAFMHERFGTAVRTRISEINRDAKAAIVIRNKVMVEDGREVSVYWAESKGAR